MVAAVWLGFLFYGSLVPFDFTWISIDVAWDKFQSAWQSKPKDGGRIDFTSNILLGIPLGFFFTGACWYTRHRLLAVMVTAVVLLWCALASVAVEFSQVYVGLRTSSRTDVNAQIIGAHVGALLWWLWGQLYWPRFYDLRRHGSRQSGWERVLWIYLIVLVGYNVVPLDLTIHPADIYHKWKAGRIEILPFSYHYNTTVRLIYALATDVLIWVPISALFVLSGRKARSQAFWWATGAVVSLEFLQLFILSRYASSTDIVAGATGAALGAWVVPKLFRSDRSEYTTERQPGHVSATLIGLVTALVWSLVLAIVFWYPFDVDVNRQLVNARLDRFFRVPLSSYYTGSTLGAITNVLQKLAFYLPLGGALSLAAAPLRGRGNDAFLALVSIMLCAGVAGVIELGQILLPSKTPGSTDIIIETIGAWLGYQAVRAYLTPRHPRQTEF